MNLEVWIAIVGIVISVLIVFAPYLWRSWQLNEEKELRRIYLKAMGKCSQIATMQQSLIAIVSDEVFWHDAVLKARVNLAEEKKRFHRALIERTGGAQSKEIEEAVDSFYDAALDGLESAKNQRWKDRANRWHSELERERIEAKSAPYVESIDRSFRLDENEEIRLREGADPTQLILKQNEMRKILEEALSVSAETALYLAYRFSILWDYQGQRSEALEALRKALDLVLEQGQDAPAALQIQVLNRAAHLANKQAYCDEAERFAEKMLELSREAKQDANVAAAFQRLGRLNYFRCNSELARELLEESLVILQKLEPKDFRAIAWAQFDIGMLEVDQDDLTSARHWLEKCLATLTLPEGEGIKSPKEHFA